MKKITHITLKYDDGKERVCSKERAKWLLIVTDVTGWKQISLSGDDVNNAYLLKILENAVVQEMNDYNKYKEEDKSK
jgi:hypothetical protein